MSKALTHSVTRHVTYLESIHDGRFYRQSNPRPTLLKYKEKPEVNAMDQYVISSRFITASGKQLPRVWPPGSDLFWKTSSCDLNNLMKIFLIITTGIADT
tara:strand:+ start:338 stop:637 length:300 start_codon:yes stop_codon:yes gene_type:complete